MTPLKRRPVRVSRNDGVRLGQVSGLLERAHTGIRSFASGGGARYFWRLTIDLPDPPDPHDYGITDTVVDVTGGRIIVHRSPALPETGTQQRLDAPFPLLGLIGSVDLDGNDPIVLIPASESPIGGVPVGLVPGISWWPEQGATY